MWSLSEACAPFAPSRPYPEYLYDLFGIAVHHGGMQNGHYTSFVRQQASWYHCDDACVQPASVQQVRSCKAYMLFYVRKKLQS